MYKKIYMDACCLNRPFDDQAQDRIYLEAEAILAILSHCQKGEWLLVASDMIEYELSRHANNVKLQKVYAIYSIAGERISVTPETKTLSKKYQDSGIKLLDSLHLALCETYGVDVLLTTDDKFIRAAASLKTRTKVVNPVVWLMEVTQNER